MLFAFLCTDKPGCLQVRLDNRPTHVEWLNRLNDAGQLKFAGPFLGEDNKSTGSLVVVVADDLAAAQALAAEDPYAKAGLFEKTEVKAWNWVFNNPEA